MCVCVSVHTHNTNTYTLTHTNTYIRTYRHTTHTHIRHNTHTHKVNTHTQHPSPTHHTNIERSIDIERKNGLLKVCYVPASSATFLAFSPFFLMWPLTVLIKQTRQTVRAIKQSILLRCIWNAGTTQRKNSFF